MTCPWTSSSENHIPQHVVPQDIKKLILIFDNKNTFKSSKFMTIYTHRDYEAEPYHCQEQKLSYVQTVAPDPYTWSMGPRKLAQLPSWIINTPNEVNNPFSITPDRNPDQTKLQFSNSVWWNSKGFLSVWFGKFSTIILGKWFWKVRDLGFCNCIWFSSEF